MTSAMSFTMSFDTVYDKKKKVIQNNLIKFVLEKVKIMVLNLIPLPICFSLIFL